MIETDPEIIAKIADPVDQATKDKIRAAAHGVPINPALPKNFDCTANDDRPQSHQKWWNRPYVETYTWERHRWPAATDADRQKWYAAWPSGTRYDVRCLDGGAWDRPTCWGMFATLEEALTCARS